ncbi:BQ5605_C052g12579 [Microbotryum silenes-dioicae]|uniref:BQ5605_C052g12579 protein n=1 Tax=Microbotryum silenes-dioicae TaxID=796604 RepID=A0A2X0PP55_9BASI|nr:BQ5605_C052g12579 [Microbotryum silenes-dioicae]
MQVAPLFFFFPTLPSTLTLTLTPSLLSLSLCRVVGAAETKPTKKALAAQKRLASQPALSAVPKGQDPTLTTVDKPLNDKADHHSGRPDKSAYDKEQETLRAQIEALQLKSTDVRNRIAAASGKGPNQDRKVALRAQLDTLRAESQKLKGGRGSTFEQLKAMQDGVSNKIKELQAAKSKAPFKSVTEVDAQIKSLERQVESGTMKLVDEKKALQEISNLKKARKNVESFSTQQVAIDEERKKIEEIRATMDSPETKANQDKINEVRAELDEINKQHDEVSKGRDALFEERNAISKQLDEVYDKKKASALAYREANDKYYQKMHDDRQKRQERFQAERKANEDAKRNEINLRLLEEAQAPAFEREIEDCRNLIDSFNKRIGNVSSNGTLGNSTPLYERSTIAGVKALELRKVEEGPPAGAVALKKKSDQEEESWGGFGGKSKKKGGGNNVKKSTATNGAVTEGDTPASSSSSSSQALNLPFGTLSALLTLGIPAPLTLSDVPSTIEALETKKKYLVDNQDRVTKERVVAVEKKIKAAEAKSSSNGVATEEKKNQTEELTESSEKVEDALEEA